MNIESFQQYAQDEDLEPFINEGENPEDLKGVYMHGYDVESNVKQSWAFAHFVTAHAPCMEITGPGYACQARFDTASRMKPNYVLTPFNHSEKHFFSMSLCLEYDPMHEYKKAANIGLFVSNFWYGKFPQKNLGFDFDSFRLFDSGRFLDVKKASKPIYGIVFAKNYNNQEELVTDLQKIDTHLQKKFR